MPRYGGGCHSLPRHSRQWMGVGVQGRGMDGHLLVPEVPTCSSSCSFPPLPGSSFSPQFEVTLLRIGVPMHPASSQWPGAQTDPDSLGSAWPPWLSGCSPHDLCSLLPTAGSSMPLTWDSAPAVLTLHLAQAPCDPRLLKISRACP